MAYKGYLLKIGNYTFPHEYIQADTYSAYVNMQDVDPWTDGDCLLHRNAVELKALKVEFNLVPQLTNAQLSKIMGQIKANYTNEQARECMVTAYIPELDDYVTQKSYRVDIKPQIYGIFDGVIKYDEIRVAIVGGVA